MNDPNAYLAREIDRLANDYHAMGNHNRAIARDRIQKYQERKFYAPNHAQMSGAVRGGDRYDSRKSVPWKLIALVSAILFLSYAIFRSL